MIFMAIGTTKSHLISDIYLLTVPKNHKAVKINTLLFGIF